MSKAKVLQDRLQWADTNLSPATVREHEYRKIAGDAIAELSALEAERDEARWEVERLLRGFLEDALARDEKGEA